MIISKRLKIYINDNFVLGADLQYGGKLGDALIELGNSLNRLEDGQLRDVKFDGSQKKPLSS